MFEKEINLVNKYLKTHFRMNFEMCHMSRLEFELHGFKDEAGDNNIVIIFETPHMAACCFSFTYEGEGDFISIVTGEEARNINKKYGVTIGNIIFKITNTNMEGDMVIIAKNIKVQITGFEEAH